MAKEKLLVVTVGEEDALHEEFAQTVLSQLGDAIDVEHFADATTAIAFLKKAQKTGKRLGSVVVEAQLNGKTGDEFLVEAEGLFPEAFKFLIGNDIPADVLRNAINNTRLVRVLEVPLPAEALKTSLLERIEDQANRNKLETSNHVLRTLHDTIQELAAVIQSDKLAKLVLTNALWVTEAERGTLLQEEMGTLRIRGALDAEKKEQKKLNELLDEQASLPAVNDELERLAKVMKAKKRPEYQLVVPVKKRNEHIATLVLENPRSFRGFTEGQQELLDLLASQAAVSLDNARLYHELQEKNESTLDSIRYARRIIQALLPKPEEITHVFPESFVYLRPLHIVGGDFAWYTTHGDRRFLASIDCTGHGVPGSLMSVIGSSFIRQIIDEFGVQDPEVVLEYLNLRVTETLHQDDSDQNAGKDGMDLALVCIDDASNTLLYAGAKQPLYRVRKGKVSVFAPTKLSIGGNDSLVEDISFNAEQIPLESGDAFYMFSDGVVDQFGGPNNKRYGSKRLQQFLADLSDLPLPDQREAYHKELEAWMDQEPQVDDIMLIGFRV